VDRIATALASCPVPFAEPSHGCAMFLPKGLRGPTLRKAPSTIGDWTMEIV
jgi:hypothetical protein